MLVFIDPGHGGSDPGAVSNGLMEKDINLQVALRLRDILENNGIATVMSRDDDTYVGINQRVRMANQSGADYFISIHANAGGGEGTETLYYTRESVPFAEIIQNNFVNQMGTIDRGIIFRDNLGVIKRTYMPSVLLELGFIDSPVDADMLQNRQEDMAWAIANGFFELLGMSPMSRAKNSRRPRETSRGRVHKEGPPAKAPRKNSMLPFLLFMTMCGKK